MICNVQIVSYDDASKTRQEILNNATEDLSRLLSKVVTSYHEQWATARSRIEDEVPYKRYVELLGMWNYAFEFEISRALL